MTMPTCPRQNCEQSMMPVLGLERSNGNEAEVMHVRCPRCGHAGLTVGGEGLHLVFRAGQEYCFTLGSTPDYLTIWLTADAMAAYRPFGLSEDMLARHAAEWLLLWGRKSGLFILSPEQPGFLGFHHYLQHSMLHKTSRVA